MPGTIFSFTPRKVSRDLSIQLPFLFLLQYSSLRDLPPSDHVKGIRRDWEHGVDSISAGFSLDGFILRQVLLLKDPLLESHREITRITLCPQEHFRQPKTGHFTINTQQKVHSVGIFLSRINSTEEKGTKLQDISSGWNIWSRVPREENKREKSMGQKSNSLVDQKAPIPDHILCLFTQFYNQCKNIIIVGIWIDNCLSMLL